MDGPRPKDMTQDELEALPTGPFLRTRREATMEDFEKGHICGRWVETAVMPKQMLTAYLPDDIIFFRDRKGSTWGFGQWATGQWFKQPVGL